MKPSWLDRFDRVRAGRDRGIIFERNTADLVYYPESGIPPCRLKLFLAQLLAPHGYRVASFSLAHGLQELRPPSTSHDEHSNASGPFASIREARDQRQVLDHLSRILRRREEKVALILDYADDIVPSAQGMTAILNPDQVHAREMLHSWGTDDGIRGTDNLFILISYEGQISDLLTRGGSGFQRITIDLPSLPERGSFIEFLCSLRAERRRTDIGELAPNLTPDELARITSGVPYTEIEDLFRHAAAVSKPVDREMVRERKARAIDQLCRGMVQVHEPLIGFESVKGLRHAVEHLRALVPLFRSGSRSVPRGILLIGVPGCGKSHLVLAFAKELGFPCLAMRMVREGLVGASERNLEQVLWVAANLKPCLIWMEEIDQVLGRRGGGQSLSGGVEERLMGRIWEFMGDDSNRGVYWIATSNRPDLLDPATLDRFQRVVPFLHPTPTEVAELLPTVANQVGRKLADDVDVSEIAHLPSLRNPTVRALQEIVGMAGTWADQDNGQPDSPVTREQLRAAVLDFKPNYDPDQHQFIALTAIQMTPSTSLLPWMGRNGKRPDAELPDYLDGIVDHQTGGIDHAALNNRLHELALRLRGR